MLIEFTIKIFLIIFDSLIFCGIVLLCIFNIYDYHYNIPLTFLTILIPISFFSKLLYWFIINNRKNEVSKNTIIERFIATILAYIIPLYILWNTPTLFINKEVLDIIYILMSVFFIAGIFIEKKLFFYEKEINKAL